MINTENTENNKLELIKLGEFLIANDDKKVRVLWMLSEQEWNHLEDLYVGNVNIQRIQYDGRLNI